MHVRSDEALLMHATTFGLIWASLEKPTLENVYLFWVRSRYLRTETPALSLFGHTSHRMRTVYVEA